MASTEEIIGRRDVNDVEQILMISNTDVEASIHAVKDNADAIFTWDYEKGARPALNKLYEKAKEYEKMINKIEYNHIYREKNIRADELSNMGLLFSK